MNGIFDGLTEHMALGDLKSDLPVHKETKYDGKNIRYREGKSIVQAEQFITCCKTDKIYHCGEKTIQRKKDKRAYLWIYSLR